MQTNMEAAVCHHMNQNIIIFIIFIIFIKLGFK